MVSILEIARKIANNKELSTEEKRVNERALKEFQNAGIAPQGQFNFNLRSMISFPIATKVDKLKENNYNNKIWDRLTIIDNLQNSIKIPYISESNCQFKDNGYTNDNFARLESKTFKPHRVTAILEISNNVLRSCSKDLSQEITEELQKAIYNKIVEVLLSDGEENQDRPKGILNGIAKHNINSYNDFLEFVMNGETISNNMCLLFSPKAKYNLFILSDRFNIINNSVNGVEAITDNRVKDNNLLMIDFSQVIIALFGATSITIDNVTKAKDNTTTLIIDVYADFDIKPNSMLLASA